MPKAAALKEPQEILTKKKMVKTFQKSLSRTLETLSHTLVSNLDGMIASELSFSVALYLNLASMSFKRK